MTGGFSRIPLPSIHVQKQAADRSFITHEVGDVPVRLVKSLFTKMSKSRSAAEVAGAQLRKPVSLSPDNASKGGDARESGHAEQVWDLQCSSDQSPSAMSAFEHIQSLCENVGLDVPTAILDAERLIAQGLAVISENSVLFAALTAGSDALNIEKVSLRREIDKLKDELSSQQSSE